MSAPDDRAAEGTMKPNPGAGKAPGGHAGFLSSPLRRAYRNVQAKLIHIRASLRGAGAAGPPSQPGQPQRSPLPKGLTVPPGNESTSAPLSQTPGRTSQTAASTLSTALTLLVRPEVVNKWSPAKLASLSYFLNGSTRLEFGQGLPPNLPAGLPSRGEGPSGARPYQGLKTLLTFPPDAKLIGPGTSSGGSGAVAELPVPVQVPSQPLPHGRTAQPNSGAALRHNPYARLSACGPSQPGSTGGFRPLLGAVYGVQPRSMPIAQSLASSGLRVLETRNGPGPTCYRAPVPQQPVTALARLSARPPQVEVPTAPGAGLFPKGVAGGHNAQGSVSVAAATSAAAGGVPVIPRSSLSQHSLGARAPVGLSRFAPRAASLTPVAQPFSHPAVIPPAVLLTAASGAQELTMGPSLPSLVALSDTELCRVLEELPRERLVTLLGAAVAMVRMKKACNEQQMDELAKVPEQTGSLAPHLHVPDMMAISTCPPYVGVRDGSSSGGWVGGGEPMQHFNVSVPLQTGGTVAKNAVSRQVPHRQVPVQGQHRPPVNSAVSTTAGVSLSLACSMEKGNLPARMPPAAASPARRALSVIQAVVNGRPAAKRSYSDFLAGLPLNEENFGPNHGVALLVRPGIRRRF